MRPDLSRALQGVGNTLISKIIPEVSTPFGQQEAGLAAQLAFWAAEEAERGADRLVTENRITRELLQDGLPLAGEAGADVKAALATPAAPDFRLSSLQAENDGVRRGLIALQTSLESNDSPDAHELSERIWAELVESTRRRRFQARLG
ncbi:MAG: hypothetical protein AB7N24_18805 [Dehalococcoidia bacterium]